MRALRHICLGALIGAPLTAPAASATVPPVIGSPLPVESVLQVALALGAVLVLILGGAWLLRRVGKFSAAANGQLRILGGTSLGSRERVVLMQVGRQQLLLGVAPGRVSTLHVFDGGAPALDAAADVPTTGFRELLRRKTQAADGAGPARS